MIAKVVSSAAYGEIESASRVALIQARIPMGLMRVREVLEAEVRALAGARYARGAYARHGKNPGSVVLGGQRVGIDVPRVRDHGRGVEIPLMNYRALHQRGAARRCRG